MKEDFEVPLKQTSSFKKFIFPIITIFLFVAVVGGISYAFFGVAISNNVSFLNATVPNLSMEGKSINISTSGDCAINLTMDDLTKDNIAYSTPTASSTCEMGVEFSGTYGDYCTYDINLVSAGTPYTPSPGTNLIGQSDFTFTVSGDYAYGPSDYVSFLPSATLSGGNIDSYIGNDVIGNTGNIRIENGLESGVSKKSYTLNIYFSNLDIDQTALLKNSGSTKYQFKLKVDNLVCHWT